MDAIEQYINQFDRFSIDDMKQLQARESDPEKQSMLQTIRNIKILDSRIEHARTIEERESYGRERRAYREIVALKRDSAREMDPTVKEKNTRAISDYEKQFGPRFAKLKEKYEQVDQKSRSVEQIRKEYEASYASMQMHLEGAKTRGERREVDVEWVRESNKLAAQMEVALKLEGMELSSIKVDTPAMQDLNSHLVKQEREMEPSKALERDNELSLSLFKR